MLPQDCASLPPQIFLWNHKYCGASRLPVFDTPIRGKAAVQGVERQVRSSKLLPARFSETSRSQRRHWDSDPDDSPSL